MTQIQQIQQHVIHTRRRTGQSRAFEARYCGSANDTTNHPENFRSFLVRPDPAKHIDVTKPRMWQENRMWKCQLDTVAGTGTTQAGAWSQMWALLSITHPWLCKPHVFESQVMEDVC